MRPLGKIQRLWNPDLAYAIGLITTDGNLSCDGRHINFTTKDYDLALTYRDALKINNVIGRKARAGQAEKKYYVVQFGDILFYRFLQELGLTPNKSKTLGALRVPRPYFFDFYRGCIDGDGSIQTFKHPESRHLQLRVRLTSASPSFLEWLLLENREIGLRGFIVRRPGLGQLEYGKADSIELLNKMYYPGFRHCLKRKLEKAKPYLRA